MSAEVVHITSLDDPRVDVFRNVRDADLRGREDLFMAESELVLRRLMQTPDRLHSILLSPQKFARLQAELRHLPATVPILVAELPLFHEIAAFHVHRGVLAAGFRLPAQALSLDTVLGHLRASESATLMLTEGITNVDNMGALFRNAAAFGVDGIVLDSTCCDPLYRKAIRVSMGHVLSIPYAVSQSWIDDLVRLRTAWGFTLIAAEATEAARPARRMPRTRKSALVFGSEGHGLPHTTLACCDAICAIPMHGNVPSLNVATAAAVLLYEHQRCDHADSA